MADFNTHLEMTLMSLETIQIPSLLHISERIDDSKYITIQKLSNSSYIISGYNIATENYTKCPTCERIKFLAKFNIEEFSLRKL